MANKIYPSAGTYTSEKDLTFTTETVGVTTLGLVGETLKGPAFQPMFIRNYDEFKVMFGGTSPEKFRNTQIVKYELPYIAKSYLTQSNQLFVTRILGLSGYNAGPAFAIRSLGSGDIETFETTSSVSQDIAFTFTTGLTFEVAGGGLLVNEIANLTGVNLDKFNTTFQSFFSTLNVENSNWYTSDVLYWGSLTEDQIDLIIDERDLVATGGTSVIDSYILPENITLAQKQFYIVNNEFVFNENTDLYNGKAFTLYAHTFTTNIDGSIEGTITLRNYTQTCEPNQKYHKKLLATLRSRGSFINEQLNFNVDASTLGLINTEIINSNPLGSFDVTGSTTGGVQFNYTVSLDSTKTNFIKNVLGTSNFDKDTNIFVEDVYDKSIRYGLLSGEIRGIDSNLITLSEQWSNNEIQFQSPETPFLVSELRGGLPQRLFKFISISDGSNANTEVKVSITNVDLSKKTFDVLVRSFNDSDKNPVILERYFAVGMDEKQNNYIGRRIGTIDNKYPLRSSYVILEMDPNAPTDAVPAGFEGYVFRNSVDTDNVNITDITNSEFIGVPEIPFKTKYYNPGEVIVAPPLRSPIISNGDKVRKVYLGFSDIDGGFDFDLLKYKGRKISQSGNYGSGAEWLFKTKGFHMDIDASNIVDVNGNQTFAFGSGTFTDPALINSTISHPYHDIRTRKFTVAFSGGFDGWDIYRESRTNTNGYELGGVNAIAAGFESFVSSEYGETFGVSDYYSFLLGLRSFENPEQTSINILATPGIDIINNTNLIREAIEIVEEKRFDSIYIPTLPDIKLLANNNAGNTEDWLYPEDIINELELTEIDSNYTAVYYPWIQISDTENNANLFIPPTAEVVKNLAFTDNVAHPWFATAGYNRGIVNCIRARIPLNQEDRDTLYPGRINPIATFSDVGTVIWGNNNLQINNTALNKLNIRRLLLQARRLIVSVSNRLLFDPNDTQIRSEFISLVNPILDNIRRERGLTDFRISLVNDVEDDDRNTLRGRIFIKPTPTLEFIELEFVVTPTSVSFDNL